MGMRKNAEIANVGDARLVKFVEGLLEGKSMMQAGINAGYTEQTAKNAYRSIMPRARALFQEALGRRLSIGHLAKRIAEGVDAEETKFATFEGKFTDARQVVNHRERREMIALAAKLMAIEPTDTDRAPGLTVNMNFGSVTNVKE